MLQIALCGLKIAVIKTDRKLIHIVMQIMTQDFVFFFRFLEYLKLMTEPGKLRLEDSFILQPGIQPALIIQQGENG